LISGGNIARVADLRLPPAPPLHRSGGFLCDHLDRFPQFLFCHRAEGSMACARWNSPAAPANRPFPQFHALLDVRLTRLEADLVQLNL